MPLRIDDARVLAEQRRGHRERQQERDREPEHRVQRAPANSEEQTNLSSLLFVLPDHLQDLQLRHLLALQAIAEEGSFWAAADRLDCSPSALSQQIASLEAAVGHRLIERSRGRRHVALTEPGELLLRHAAPIVARLRAVRADLAAFGEGKVGRLRVGTYQSVGAKILPRLFRRFVAEWPSIELQIVEGSSDDELLRSVEHGDLDLTFCVLPLPEGPFEAVELMSDPYVLAVPKGAVLARSRTATLGRLRGVKLVGFRLDRTVLAVEDLLRTHGVEPNVVFRSNDNGIVQGMVAAGLGMALVPRLALDEPDPAIHVVRLPEMPPRVLAMAWHHDRYRSPAALAIVDHARAVCRELTAPRARPASTASAY